jgi:hypothetical protein
MIFFGHSFNSPGLEVLITWSLKKSSFVNMLDENSRSHVPFPVSDEAIAKRDRKWLYEK